MKVLFFCTKLNMCLALEIISLFGGKIWRSES